ncbi:MucBP domain-containing protein [Erysipelothrix inopinata]|uniref:MucBP domain-containing protein n=1 Tax=Erysipelothrix inopinata TaxID=225084 RepID=A0A7G9S1A9_9FIRM|nr:MucBP domain-containing protein [Erysipelothrix inopinata]QNN61634.1 MucBP domain-containing protein [Erysipelothrix inopinata]
MKKKFSLYLLALILMVTPVALNVAADNDPFEGQIVLNQSVVKLEYEDGEVIGKLEVNLPLDEFGPWQRLMSETENSTWTAHDDNLLTDLMNGGNVFRETPYTYYGYYILYKDGTKEIGYERTLTYEMLHQKEIDNNKRIDVVEAYFGETSQMILNYQLKDIDGSTSLIRSDVTYGKYDLKYLDEINVKGETQPIAQDLISKYILVDSSTPMSYAYTKENSAFDVNLRLPIYTIQFQDEEGNSLRANETIQATLDKAFEYVAPGIEGYEIKGMNKISSPYTNEDKEFTLVYSKKVTDSVGPEDPVDPVDPVKPVEPSKPTNPVKPTKKVKSNETLPGTGIGNSDNLAAATFIITGITFLGVSVLKKKEL